MRTGLEKTLKYCAYWNNHFICEKSLKSNGCYGWERDEGKKYFCTNWWWTSATDGAEESKCCPCTRPSWLPWSVAPIPANISIFSKHWCLPTRYAPHLASWGCADRGHPALIEAQRDYCSSTPSDLRLGCLPLRHYTSSQRYDAPLPPQPVPWLWPSDTSNYVFLRWNTGLLDQQFGGAWLRMICGTRLGSGMSECRRLGLIVNSQL